MFDILTSRSIELSIEYDILNSQYLIILAYFQVNLYKQTVTPKEGGVVITINVWL